MPSSLSLINPSFSLLSQRKTTTTPKDKNGRKPSAAEKHAGGKAVHVPLNTAKGVIHQVKPVAAAPIQPSSTETPTPHGNTQHAIAQAAVGRGIRHSIGYAAAPAVAAAASAAATTAPPPAPEQNSTKFLIPTRVEDSLSQLASNYQNSLVDMPSFPDQAGSTSQPSYAHDPFPSLLSRNSSLVDLAMIPTLEEGEGDAVPSVPGMNFVDFPQPEVDPSKYRVQAQPDEQQSNQAS